MGRKVATVREWARRLKTSLSNHKSNGTMEKLYGFLPGICLGFFVLARLTSHILFVWASIKYAKLEKIWGFFFYVLLRKETLHRYITYTVAFISLSLGTSLLHSILNTLLTIKCAAAIKRFLFFLSILPFWRHLEALCCLSLFQQCLWLRKTELDLCFNSCHVIVAQDPPSSWE